MRQLRMRRAHLGDLPKVVLPEGDRLRKATFPDAIALADVLGASFPEYGWTAEKVRGELLHNPEVFETFVIDRGKKPVATASCKRTGEDPHLGYLHWCGVQPEAQGARLGRMVCIAVLKAFAAEGMTAAILDTDDFRMPAIKTYLNLDFEPEIRDEEDRERWSKILSALALPKEQA